MAIKRDKQIAVREDDEMQTEHRNENGERILFSWRAQEHVQVNKLAKHRNWVVGISIVLALWALYNSNFLFLVILLLWLIIAIVSMGAQPRRHEFCVTETGITVNHEMFPYIDMQRFWIVPRIINKKKIFVMKFSNPMKSSISVPVPLDYAEDVRLTINQYVPQSEHHFSMADMIDGMFS